MRRGSRLVELQGGVNETALIRGIQWDTYGLEVLHLDLARVSAGEKVRVKLSLELRGEAPGTREGGIVEQVLHDVEIECPAAAIPDRIEVSIRGLHFGRRDQAGRLAPAGGCPVAGRPRRHGRALRGRGDGRSRGGGGGSRGGRARSDRTQAVRRGRGRGVGVCVDRHGWETPA